MKYLARKNIRCVAVLLTAVFALTAALRPESVHAFDTDQIYIESDEIVSWFSDPIAVDGNEEEVFEISSSVVNSDNAKTCFKFIVGNMNLNSAAACGILANIALESAFRPDALGDNGTSYGICQWHDQKEGSGRWTSLKNYCSSNDLDWTTLDGQLKYLAYEADKNYPATMKAMRAVENTAEGAWEAGRVWCKNFEVPANYETVSKQRGDLAKTSFWPVYKDESAQDSPKDDPENSGTDTESVTHTAGQDIMVLVGRTVRVDELCFSDVIFSSDKRRYILSDSRDKKRASLTKNGKLKALKKTAEDEPVEIEAQERVDDEWETCSTASVTILPKPRLSLSALKYEGDTLDASACFSNDSASLLGGADSWKSSKPSVADIDPDTGVITAEKSGTARITAYFGEKGKTGTVAVSADIKVKIPAFSKAVYKIKAGGKLTISMKHVTAASDPVFYTGDESVATAEDKLDKNGDPTGKVVVSAVAETEDGTQETELFALINGQTYSTKIVIN